jgi:hypothetical protein
VRVFASLTYLEVTRFCIVTSIKSAVHSNCLQLRLPSQQHYEVLQRVSYAFDPLCTSLPASCTTSNFWPQACTLLLLSVDPEYPAHCIGSEMHASIYRILASLSCREMILSGVNFTVLGALFNIGAAPRPSNIGITAGGELNLCPKTPNCISTGI